MQTLNSNPCSVVAAAKEQGLTDEQTLGTVLLTLAASTLLVGLLIVLVGAPPPGALTAVGQ